MANKYNIGQIDNYQLSNVETYSFSKWMKCFWGKIGEEKSDSVHMKSRNEKILWIFFGYY